MRLLWFPDYLPGAESTKRNNMKGVKTAIIGGTGIYHFGEIDESESIEVRTDFGCVPVHVGKLHSRRIAFLARHGQDHSLAPGLIDYRANIAALKKIGVRNIFATACSGSLNPEYRVGDLVLLDQFLDFTKNRQDTFLDGTHGGQVGHIDNTAPYCKSLNELVSKAGKSLGVSVKEGAIYCCMEGPRYESSAEIKMLRILKGDLVGQTNYPEVVLAREMEQCYCAVGVVANMAAGIGESALTTSEVVEIMKEKISIIQEVLSKAIEFLDEDRDCECHHLLDQATI